MRKERFWILPASRSAINVKKNLKNSSTADEYKIF
jgi:hypothetical protein